MPTGPANLKTRFISFSGIDGAGKSTQIRALTQSLTQYGLRVRVIPFWDEVARLKRVREGVGHSIFKGDKGVGTHSAPVNRRDKNVQSSFMTVIRLGLYLVDAFSARRAVTEACRSNDDVVIFDRYIYDELANLSLRNPGIGVFVRLVMKIVPQPDISFVLDAIPAEARARKPEYPLEFLHFNRSAYLTLSEMIDGVTVVPAMPVEQVKQEILRNTSISIKTIRQEPDRPRVSAHNDRYAARQAGTGTKA
jgi:thymidylate kinase